MSVELKIVLLGESEVGKTCIVNRYITGRYSASTVTTVGAAFASTTRKIDGEDIVVGIWDTCGMERYESISKIYYRGAKAAIVCYDLTKADTFRGRAQFWVGELLKNLSACKIFLVGTKVDLLADHARGTPVEEVEAYAESIGATMMETSSLTGTNVNELFDLAIRTYVKERGPKAAPKNVVNPAAAASNDGCGC